VSTSGAASGTNGTVTIGGKTYPIQTGTSATGTSTAAKQK
jgi:hypothetical protein